MPTSLENQETSKSYSYEYKLIPIETIYSSNGEVILSPVSQEDTFKNAYTFINQTLMTQKCDVYEGWLVRNIWINSSRKFKAIAESEGRRFNELLNTQNGDALFNIRMSHQESKYLFKNLSFMDACQKAIQFMSTTFMQNGCNPLEAEAANKVLLKYTKIFLDILKLNTEMHIVRNVIMPNLNITKEEPKWCLTSEKLESLSHKYNYDENIYMVADINTVYIDELKIVSGYLDDLKKATTRDEQNAILLEISTKCSSVQLQSKNLFPGDAIQLENKIIITENGECATSIDVDLQNRNINHDQQDHHSF